MDCKKLEDKPPTMSLEKYQEAQKDEIITIGGHLDSWDTGEGAHDDGAGNWIHCFEAMRILKDELQTQTYAEGCIFHE